MGALWAWDGLLRGSSVVGNFFSSLLPPSSLPPVGILLVPPFLMNFLMSMLLPHLLQVVLALGLGFGGGG